MRAPGALLLLALALGGCAPMGPDYKRPQLDLPARYPDDAASPGAAVPVPANWWRLFEDPLLDKLVATGLAQNMDVKIAVARLEEAEAALREANATQFPEIDANAFASRVRSSTRAAPLPSGAPPIRNNFQLSANTSFEIDFWGRLRRLREAARAQYIGTRYGRDVVALTLAAAISQTYFTVRSLDAQLIVADETLRAAVDSVDIARRRAQAGVVSDLDVNQAEANRSQLAAQIKDLRRLRAVAVHQLGVLTGAPGANLEAGDLRQLSAPPLPPTGLPSTLLERRPDLREAEAALVSANAQIGVARAAQFPTFSITGALGTQTADLANLLASGAGIWSIGLGAVGPIIDSGRYAARTEQAEARARQAAAVYERRVQNAFREVADSLSNVRLAADAEQDLRDRAERARNTLRLATLRYDAGYSAYLEVLDAQRTFNDAQLALVRNRQSYLGYTVDLMNALGGGWTPY